MLKGYRLIGANIAVFAALFAFALLFSPEIIGMLKAFAPATITLIALSPEAGMTTMVFIAIASALLIDMPILVISLHLWLKSNDIYRENEIKFMHNTIFLSIFLFYIGTAFGFISYTQWGIPFFVWADSAMGIASTWGITLFTAQLLMSSVVMGVLFLVPIMLHYLIKQGFLSVETLRKQRLKVGIGIAAMIFIVPFLPSAPVQQLMVGIVLYGLYESVIWFNSRHPAPMVATA